MGDSHVKLNIGQWNLNPWYQRRNEVESMISKSKLDLLVMNDTRSCSKMNIEIGGYDIERNDHPENTRRPGGSAIAIQNTISYKRIITSSKESVCVEIKNGMGEFRILTVYAHPGELVDKKLIEEAEKDAKPSTSFLLIGDFNAHIGLDNDKDPDRAGIHLIDLMSHYDFHLLNNNEPTYSSCSCSSMSCIDLAFLKSGSTNLMANWEVLEPGSSDHSATLVTLYDSTSMTNAQHNDQTISVTDWDLYRAGLEKALEIPYNNLITRSETDSHTSNAQSNNKLKLQLERLKSWKRPISF